MAHSRVCQRISTRFELSGRQNFLTIFAVNGELIESTTIDAPGGFTDLRQPRISGAALNNPTPVSESGITLVLGSSLSAVAL